LRPFATVPAGELGQLLELAERNLEPDDAGVPAARGPVYALLLDIVELSEREQSSRLRRRGQDQPQAQRLR
jgi:hypothetical protein